MLNNKEMMIANVGDGLCGILAYDNSHIIQFDFGGDKDGVLAAQSFEFFCDYYNSPSTLLISHLHADHYNGLLALQANNNAILKYDHLFYPGIPSFPDPRIRTEFLSMLLAINRRSYGSDGFITVELIEAVKQLNSINFTCKSCYKGDKIPFAGRSFKVLWPPKIVDEDTLKCVKVAIETFSEALKSDQLLQKYYNQVNEINLSNYFDKNPIQCESNRDFPFFENKNKIEKSPLPDITKNANDALKTAANHLSLAVCEGNRLLWFGDCEKSGLKIALWIISKTYR